MAPPRRLVLVHGFTQTGASWRPVEAALASCEPSLAVATPDLPGHGGAAGERPASLAEAAAALGATGGRATYAGYSMGARVCLRLALDRPELVERLVLVGATAGLADGAAREARRGADEALAARLETMPVGEFLEEWLAGPLFAHLSSEQADRPGRLANTPAGLGFALRRRGTGAEPAMWERLGELEMPGLLLAGEHDAKFSALAEQMATAIGERSEVALVEGAGHAAPFEKPARFAALVTSWLARNPAPGAAGGTPAEAGRDP